MLTKLLLIPGLIWLLLPPVCVCHLPGKLLGNYQDPPASEQVAQSAIHAPGCPAARIHTASGDEDDDPGDQPLVVSLTCDAEPLTHLASSASFDFAFDPGESTSHQDLYLILCALRN